MKLSFSTLGCPDWDLGKIAEKASEYGFGGVELRARGRQHIDPSFTRSERLAARKLFSEREVEICCLSGYSRFASLDRDELKENTELLLSYISLAVDLGAPYIRTFVGEYPEEAREEDIVENAASCLEKCGSKALENGVKILIETHDAFSLSAKVLKVLKLIRNDGVGVIWDIHHPYRFGESPEETYENLGSYIKHVHIKDEADGKLCLQGEGTLPVPQFVGLLESKGYDGYYSLEWEKFWERDLEEPEIAFPKYVEYMRGLRL